MGTKKGRKYTSKVNIDPSNVTNKKPVRATSVVKYDTGLTRTKQDVGRWRQALLQAESKFSYNRTELYRLLKDVVLDAHLSSVVEQRKNATLAREVCFYNSDGTENEVISELFETSWFMKMRSMMLDARICYGFTLIDLGELVDDKFPDIKIVERQYVKPEFGIVVAQPADITGIAFEDPKYAKWNIFVGEKQDLGLLTKAAPWVLWKKTITAYWSEYCEKFGMPMRIGKTNLADENLKANMETSLREMGAAFWAMMDKEDSIELLETFNTAAYDIYDKFIERANSEISKLILCQTGTTDEKSFVGSAAVHQDVLGMLVQQDVIWHDNYLNEVIKPTLEGLGFPLSDGYFETKYEEKASLKDKMEMVAKFMPYVKFDKTYLEEEFGIVIESVNDMAKAAQKQQVNDVTRRYYDTL